MKFTVTIGKIQELLTVAVGRGEVSLIPNRIDTASIDRIDSTLHYFDENIQVVPWWYNAAKSEFTTAQVETQIRKWAARPVNSDLL